MDKYYIVKQHTFILLTWEQRKPVWEYFIFCESGKVSVNRTLHSIVFQNPQPLPNLSLYRLNASNEQYNAFSNWSFFSSIQFKGWRLRRPVLFSNSKVKVSYFFYHSSMFKNVMCIIKINNEFKAELWKYVSLQDIPISCINQGVWFLV